LLSEDADYAIYYLFLINYNRFFAAY